MNDALILKNMTGTQVALSTESNCRKEGQTTSVSAVAQQKLLTCWYYEKMLISFLYQSVKTDVELERNMIIGILEYFASSIVYNVITQTCCSAVALANKTHSHY